MSGQDIFLSVANALIYATIATGLLISALEEKKQRKETNAELKRANDLYEKSLQMIEAERNREGNREL